MVGLNAILWVLGSLNFYALGASVECQGLAKMHMPPEGKPWIVPATYIYDPETKKVGLDLVIPENVGKKRIANGSWDGNASSIVLKFVKDFRYGDLREFSPTVFWFQENKSSNGFLSLETVDQGLAYFMGIFECPLPPQNKKLYK